MTLKTEPPGLVHVVPMSVLQVVPNGEAEFGVFGRLAEGAGFGANGIHAQLSVSVGFFSGFWLLSAGSSSVECPCKVVGRVKSWTTARPSYLLRSRNKIYAII